MDVSNIKIKDGKLIIEADMKVLFNESKKEIAPGSHFVFTGISPTKLSFKTADSSPVEIPVSELKCDLSDLIHPFNI